MERNKRHTLLEIRDLSIGYGKTRLYGNISFDVLEGDCIMLCGANGSGKTTLLKSLAGMSCRNPDDGCPIMVPTRIPKIKGFTLKEFIRISCFSQSDMAGCLSGDDERRMDMSLSHLGLSDLSYRDISMLSDGEFQKAGIAAALVRRASVILLDEPTSFLDAENRVTVLRTLRSLCEGEHESGLCGTSAPAVIFSTHDLHEGLEVCSKVLALGADGKFRHAPHVSESGIKEMEQEKKEMKMVTESIFRR